MTPVIPRSSNIPGKAPAGSQLQLGELAINNADGSIFLKIRSQQGVESVVAVGAEALAAADAAAASAAAASASAASTSKKSIILAIIFGS